MKAAWSLRPAVVEDLKEIVRIEQTAHRNAFWTEDLLRAELEKPYCHFLVLTDDESDTMIAGYVVFWFLFDECQILNIVIDMPYRGLGLAKMMLKRVIHLSMQAGAHKIILDVRKSNLAAIQLYQGLCFNITQIRKKFYSDGEDSYSMVLPLDGELIDF